MFKTQSTLDNFFVNPCANSSNNYEIKRYFYLIWENKFKPNVQAYWTDIKPVKINYMKQVYWESSEVKKKSNNYIKKGYYFYLCGYFADINDRAYYLSKEKIYKNVPYLISHLQKCIRKQDDILAIPTCYHLCKLNLSDLLRRLPIIMLEDTTLHESFTTIIWLMIACSDDKFKIKKYIYEWILGVVYTLCKINETDNVANNNAVNVPSNIINILDKYKYLKENEYSLLYSIHLRIAYGGLDSDIEMLKKYAELWEERFNSAIASVNISTIIIKPISTNINDLEIGDWDLSAIDYHCNSKFLEYISKKFNTIDIEELKQVIWNNSSNINKRVFFESGKCKTWNEISAYVQKTQKYLLDSSY